MPISYTELRRICLKPDEAQKPLYARVVTHTLSISLIWILQSFPLTPNGITLASLIAAFAAFPGFAELSPASVLLAVLFLELYYVLDAVDGQWARLKKNKSATGAFFDVIINYAIQPPLFFAIGWGVWSRTENPAYLLLGFLAGIGTLWPLLLWTVRNGVVLTLRASRGAQRPIQSGSDKKPASMAASPARWAFGWIHKSLVFPWLMSVLTLAGLASYAGFRFFGDPDLTVKIFAGLLFYYGLVGPAVSLAMTSHWILSRQIDRELEGSA